MPGPAKQLDHDAQGEVGWDHARICKQLPGLLFRTSIQEAVEHNLVGLDILQKLQCSIEVARRAIALHNRAVCNGVRSLLFVCNGVLVVVGQ